MLRYFILTILLIANVKSYSQLQIVNTFLNAYDVNAITICRSTINCIGPGTKVIIQATLSDENDVNIITSKTKILTLVQGLNSITDLKNVMASQTYAQNDFAQYILVHHRLPSGKFKHCITVFNLNSEPVTDYCDEVESVDNSFLTLISPSDKDTIDTKTPTLTWTHSEPFSLLAPNQYFKLILVEMDKKDADPENAVSTKQPHYLNDGVKAHQVLYPQNALSLEEGKTYAWQIQKISETDNSVIQKSEAWSFTIRKPKIMPDNKYCLLKDKIDAGYYYATNQKIFFQFQEDYYSEFIKSKIYNERHELLVPQLLSDTKENDKSKDPSNQPAVNAKVIGYNAYELDLHDYNLKAGYYYMEVTNEKNKVYTLKFYVD